VAFGIICTAGVLATAELLPGPLLPPQLEQGQACHECGSGSGGVILDLAELGEKDGSHIYTLLPSCWSVGCWRGSKSCRRRLMMGIDHHSPLKVLFEIGLGHCSGG
jgi:hypothetical protein